MCLDRIYIYICNHEVTMETVFCELHRKVLAMTAYIDLKPSYRNNTALEIQMSTWEEECKQNAEDELIRKDVKCITCTRRQMAKGMLPIDMVARATGRALKRKAKSANLLPCEKLKAYYETSKYELDGDGNKTKGDNEEESAATVANIITSYNDEDASSDSSTSSIEMPMSDDENAFFPDIDTKSDSEEDEGAAEGVVKPAVKRMVFGTKSEGIEVKRQRLEKELVSIKQREVVLESRVEGLERERRGLEAEIAKWKAHSVPRFENEA